MSRQRRRVTNDNTAVDFLRAGLFLGWRGCGDRMVGIMKQLFEVRFGRFSCYVLADDEEQAGQNLDGIMEELYAGTYIEVSGSTLDTSCDATDEAVAGMLRDSGGLH